MGKLYIRDICEKKIYLCIPTQAVTYRPNNLEMIKYYLFNNMFYIPTMSVYKTVYIIILSSKNICTRLRYYNNNIFSHYTASLFVPIAQNY